MLPQLILASASPRRSELLTSLDVAYSCRPVDVDESPYPNEPPDQYVRRLARTKAEAEANEGELVLAADTIVVQDGQLLGKPATSADARRMLSLLAGRDHAVFSGVAAHLPPDLTRTLGCLARTKSDPESAS